MNSKYWITVHTPYGTVVRGFTDPGWMVSVLNAHPDWVPAGAEPEVERTLANEWAVAAVVAERAARLEVAAAQRAARRAEREAARAEQAAATERRRLGLVEALLPGDDRHGANGYGNYDCRCPICTDAHAAAYAVRRDRSRSLPQDDERHGTDNGYHYWHCKCEACLAAHAAAHPKTRRRRVPAGA